MKKFLFLFLLFFLSFVFIPSHIKANFTSPPFPLADSGSQGYGMGKLRYQQMGSAIYERVNAALGTNVANTLPWMIPNPDPIAAATIPFIQDTNRWYYFDSRNYYEFKQAIKLCIGSYISIYNIEETGAGAQHDFAQWFTFKSTLLGGDRASGWQFVTDPCNSTLNNPVGIWKQNKAKPEFPTLTDTEIYRSIEEFQTNQPLNHLTTKTDFYTPANWDTAGWVPDKNGVTTYSTTASNFNGSGYNLGDFWNYIPTGYEDKDMLWGVLRKLVDLMQYTLIFPGNPYYNGYQLSESTNAVTNITSVFFTGEGFAQIKTGAIEPPETYDPCFWGFCGQVGGEPCFNFAPGSLYTYEMVGFPPPVWNTEWNRYDYCQNYNGVYTNLPFTQELYDPNTNTFLGQGFYGLCDGGWLQDYSNWKIHQPNTRGFNEFTHRQANSVTYPSEVYPLSGITTECGFWDGQRNFQGYASYNQVYLTGMSYEESYIGNYFGDPDHGRHLVDCALPSCGGQGKCNSGTNPGNLATVPYVDRTWSQEYSPLAYECFEFEFTSGQEDAPYFTNTWTTGQGMYGKVWNIRHEMLGQQLNGLSSLVYGVDNPFWPAGEFGSAPWIFNNTYSCDIAAGNPSACDIPELDWYQFFNFNYGMFEVGRDCATEMHIPFWDRVEIIQAPGCYDEFGIPQCTVDYEIISNPFPELPCPPIFQDGAFLCEDSYFFFEERAYQTEVATKNGSTDDGASWEYESFMDPSPGENLFGLRDIAKGPVKNEPFWASDTVTLSRVEPVPQDNKHFSLQTAAGHPIDTQDRQRNHFIVEWEFEYQTYSYRDDGTPLEFWDP